MITRRWRGTSLRAKVTGVTVAVLALGLLATGAGATVFLRTALIANLDSTVQQVAATEIGDELFDIQIQDGVVTATEKPDLARTDYHVALYQSGKPGEFIASTGGSEPFPDFPAEYSLEQAVTAGPEAFDLRDAETGARFRASVAPLEGPGGALLPQLVALPVAPVNQVVGTFLGIYTVLAVITIFVGALATRWLVTLTFRSLGQVEATADAIAGGEFSLRMTDIEPTTTEVGRLKTAINAMLDRVDAALSQRDATVRQMRRFIGDASHELRTPLVTVRGYAELYRMGAIRGDEDVTQSMERIEKEAIRMGVLVEDLLALARLDERRDVVIGPVDLRPIARDAALDLRASAPMRPVTVIDTTVAAQRDVPPVERPETTTEAPKPPPTALTRAGATLSLLRRRPKPVPASSATGARELPSMTPLPDDPAAVAGTVVPVVLGDENRIRQVVTNLIGNARRFTANDSPIDLRVGVEPSARMGWVEVVDHGEGVPDQIKDKIFQRFWRADTSRTRETGGSGLGLSIVASIVEALHGSVGVTDTPGGGATFRVSFPLAEGRGAAEQLHIETQPIERLVLDVPSPETD
ncbi:HAMP domain-containing sensor histidine kinase [Microbacterium sp. CFBP9034]|uniref:sensor histidine kinase n=1 Tax=Microbacterium sp. CFBP9034 TaxID=3096540 RepID=UPI002A6A576E|nr:HAMP domain-containing sensor histidine kinase [Microbacterium sp. CFBP9034]MDY0910846.1 HAMP domain-containing sensor histidine kinase [Microbacterium sp. CFBP9034]